MEGYAIGGRPGNVATAERAAKPVKKILRKVIKCHWRWAGGWLYY